MGQIIKNYWMKKEHGNNESVVGNLLQQTLRIFDLELELAGVGATEANPKCSGQLKSVFFVVKNNSAISSPPCKITFSKPGFTETKTIKGLLPGKDHVLFFTVNDNVESKFVASMSMSGAVVVNPTIHGTA